MKIIPVKGYVVLSELKPENKTQSGLIIPGGEEIPNNIAVLESVDESLRADLGDKVLFNRYNAVAVKDQLVVNVKDIIAVIKD